jgi:hypothetical protein
VNPEHAAAALLKIVEDERQARCRALRSRAEAEARAIVRQAQGEARQRVRAALEEARRRSRARLARAEAQYRTRVRLAHQRRLVALLQRGWQWLDEALILVWRDPARRQRWVEDCALRAAAVLPAGRWQVSHPAGWPEAEQERLRELLRKRSVTTAEMMPDTAITAGLRLVSGNSAFDATREGMLADRSAIEARLLFHLEGEAA